MGKKTLSIGGATYDIFVRLPGDTISECQESKSFALPLGGKIKVEKVIEACGGGANNTAIGLARLGCDACFDGVMGDDQWGQKLIENMQKEGVDTNCATLVEDEVSSFSIILNSPSGERVVLYEPGTNTHLHDSNFDKDMLCTVDWVFLNHIQEGSCIIQDDIIEMLSCEHSPGITWNPGGCQLDMGLEPRNNAELLRNTDLLVLNKEEARRFTGERDALEAMKKLLDAGATNVCITDGGNGTLASDGVHLYNCPCVTSTEVVDTTGAGDAFGTGVTWGLLGGLDLKESLKAGSINAASVVSTVGSQTALLTDIEIRQLLQSTSLDVSVDSL